jgi:hypothetical protein
MNSSPPEKSVDASLVTSPQETYRQRRRLILAVLLIGSTAMLSACGSSSKTPLQLPQPDPTPAVPLPDPISLIPVEWRVVADKNGDAIIGLAEEDYRSHVLNEAEILRWVLEAHIQLRYYRGEGDSGRAEDHNDGDGAQAPGASDSQ